MAKDDETFHRDEEELERVLRDEPRGVPIWAIVGGGVVAVLVIGGTIWLGLGRGEATAVPTATPSASASSTDAGSTTTPTPVATPSATSSDEATPEPEESGNPTGPDGRETLPPVDLGDPAEPSETVRVRISGVDAVDAAGVPGETSGPGVRVSVVVVNDGDRAIDLRTAVVNVYGADGTPGETVTTADTSPFPLSLAAGKRTTAVYVFTVAEANRDPIRVEVDLSVGDAIAIFEGQVD